MPQNYSRGTIWTEVEVLKYPAGLDAIKSIVVDATNVPVTDLSVRNVLPAGTIMMLSVTNSGQYVKYDGTGTIAGILRRPVDIVAQVTEGDAAAALYFHAAVFATRYIVGFTQYASALVNDLKNCRFE